jgi:hypothetical protein
MLKIIPLLLAAVAAAHGSTLLTVSFSIPTQSGNPGDLLQFSGSLTNNTGSTVFINSDSFTFAISGAVDDSPFLTNAPISLPAFGSSGSFEFLQVLIPLSQPGGTYDGTFDVLGGASDTQQDLLGSAAFHVTVNSASPSVPEPQSLILMAAGVAALAFRRRLAS